MAREAGISLLETLVALFVIATVSAAGAQILNTTMAGRAQFDDAMTRIRDLELARAVIRDDLSQLARRASRDVHGERRDYIFFGGGDGETSPLLAFSRHGWENIGGAEARGSLVYVEYWLEDGALVRVSPNRVDPARAEQVERRILLTGLEGARAEFLTRGSWSSFAQTPLEDVFGQAFPDMVSLDLELDDIGAVAQNFLVAPAR